MGEVEFGLDFFLAVYGGARRLRRTRSAFGVRAKTLAHQFSFVIFQRTGMRLLFRDADFGQYVKNGFALDLQLTGQIIDSNLHPLSVSFSCPA